MGGAVVSLGGARPESLQCEVEQRTVNILRVALGLGQGVKRCVVAAFLSRGYQPLEERSREVMSTRRIRNGEGHGMTLHLSRGRLKKERESGARGGGGEAGCE